MYLNCKHISGQYFIIQGESSLGSSTFELRECLILKNYFYDCNIEYVFFLCPRWPIYSTILFYSKPMVSVPDALSNVKIYSLEVADFDRDDDPFVR